MKKIVILLLPLIFACSSTDYSLQKKQIDELQQAYSYLEIELSKIDIKESNKTLKTYNSKIEDISKKLDPNKIPSLETMDFINEFRSIKKTFKKVPSKKIFLNNSIKANKKQLEVLLTDMNKSIFDEKELETILIQEELAISELQKKQIDLSTTISKQLIKLDSLSTLLKTQSFR